MLPTLILLLLPMVPQRQRVHAKDFGCSLLSCRCCNPYCFSNESPLQGSKWLPLLILIQIRIFTCLSSQKIGTRMLFHATWVRFVLTRCCVKGHQSHHCRQEIFSAFHEMMKFKSPEYFMHKEGLRTGARIIKRWIRARSRVWGGHFHRSHFPEAPIGSTPGRKNTSAAQAAPPSEPKGPRVANPC